MDTISTASLGDGREGEFGLELYKLLRAESSSYFDKLQALWLQKFVLVGAVIAFLATAQEKLPQSGQNLVFASAALAIPVLSALLDAKIMEFGLHSRSISRFIATHYADFDTVVAWETMLWGSSASAMDRSLVRTRSLITVLTAVVPTMLICLLSAVVLGAATGRNAACVSLGLGVCLLYAVVTWLAWTLVWNKSPA